MSSVEVQQPPVTPGLPSLARGSVRRKGPPPVMPPAVDPKDIPWRGHGGRVPTLSSVEFDRQLDKVSVWLEEWNHNQRCSIIEAILRRSKFTQFQFLSTSMQPVLHRDFMYTARTQFPALDFVPVSTHTSRRLKEKLIFTRQDNFHRIGSAHCRDDNDVKQLVQEKPVKFPNIPNGQPSPESEEKKEVSHLSGSSWLQKRSNNSNRNSVEKWVGDGTNPVFAALPNLRYIDMPVRRHIQDENSPRRSFTGKSSSFTSCKSMMGSKHPLSHPRSTQSDPAVSRKKARKHQKSTSGNQQDLTPDLMPEDGIQLVRWYTDMWSDVKRNEFLHKFLLKLDPRQHYFISSFIETRQHKDFLSLLPEDIALKILGYLTVQELLHCCQVSKKWNSLANDSSLWKNKCDTVKLEVPVLDENPQWKKLYKENKFLRVNWNDGHCKITDFKGHTDNVTCVIFDHNRLASGSLDKTIRVFDLKTARCQHILKGHVKGVWCLDFYTQHLLISGSFDGTIRIWNLRTGKCSKTIVAHEGPIWAMERYEDTLVTASQDKTVKVWQINRCLYKISLVGHSAAVFAIDISENGKLVITGSADKSVKIWDIESGKCLRWISVSQTTSIMSVSYSCGYIACSYGETICLYKVDGPTKLIRKFQNIVAEHQKRIECLKLQISDPKKGEGFMVSAGKDGRVKYWDITKEASIQTFVGHRGQAVNAIYFDVLRIASAAQDHKIRIWDFNV